MHLRSPSYAGLRPASSRTTAAARGSSGKRDTKPELILRQALWSRGLRYRIDVQDILGRPDIVFRRQRIVIFCDGDFWHGRDLSSRLRRLAQGHNAAYWTKKLRRNVQRDKAHNLALSRLGWLVLRYWESDIHSDVTRIADDIVLHLNGAPDTGPSPKPSRTSVNVNA